jgi:four helix bundle protein
MAFSSSVEVMNQLIISNELKFIDNEKYKELRTELELITAMLNSLHKSTHKRLN